MFLTGRCRHSFNVNSCITEGSSGYFSGSSISVTSQSTASVQAPHLTVQNASNHADRPLTQVEEEKRKLHKRRDLILTELLQTERM